MNSEMSEDEMEANKMRNALTAIANEMQKLHSETASSNETEKNENGETLNKLIKCKTNLNLRKIQIKKLKRNLRTACVVAKTMSSAKAAEAASLSTHLDITRSKYMDLVHQQSEKNEVIHQLNGENRALRNRLDFYNNIIQLGYKELQNMRNECEENISFAEQLKHIIVCCGQYYADHFNEHERCTRLEQKNRFLNTKIVIMESNLKAATDELRNLRTCIKPYREKRDTPTNSRHCIDVVCSEYKMGSHQRNFANVTMTFELNNCSSPTSMKDLDLTSHLKTVKKLLDDQDNLIKDLKSLSKGINVDETYLTYFIYIYLQRLFVSTHPKGHETP
ncbi:uncharacterized protein LOC110372270 [Helicoverpa armigera]|uniref:uncharacterized protein LOC110372270 n=1 Tax=Helicoverpa armigera TaxID=29058 RepID=UPI00308315DE